VIDDSLSRRIIVYASITGALGVLLGALGAHGLGTLLAELGHDADLIPKRLSQFDTGVRYHLFHSVALLALAAIPYGTPGSRRWVSRLFLLGIFLFSGSLYALVLSNVTQLGMVTPLGGLCWIFGWLMLLAVARPSSASAPQREPL
jgi:uncharacterized membrane protein YgdD (TMEM256/DUF423 family)